MTREQIFDAFRILKEKGVSHFGLHTMVVSNELQVTGLIHTAKMMFELAAEVQELLGIDIEFLDFWRRYRPPVSSGRIVHRLR